MSPATRGVTLATHETPRPLLVLGPSLGTSVEALWADVLPSLATDFDVLGFDLPGHGTAPDLDGAAASGAVTIASIAAEVLEHVAQFRAAQGGGTDGFWYAGVSVGGAIGLQLALDAPDDVAGLAVLASGARIGSPAMWNERADLVEKAGTPTQVSGAASRWFAEGFIEREGEAAARLLATLQTAGQFGYAAVCRALAGFDATDRLADVACPVLALAGAHDQATPVAGLAALAGGVPNGRLAVLHGAAHQLPVEAPDAVAELLREFAAGVTARPGTRAHRTAGAMGNRREVLGDDHVARAVAGTNAFTADFQDLITRYAWGEIWGRPGLDRRMRSAVTLTALVAGGHWEELAMHVKAALRNGLTETEVKEVLLQTAIYCGVPSANHAFGIADRALREAAGSGDDAAGGS